MDYQTVEIPNVELFSVGCFNDDCYTLDDLREMEKNFHLIQTKPIVKIGHSDEQNWEWPSLGYISQLKVVGNKLVGTLSDVPAKLGALIKSGAYGRQRSAEIFWNFKDGSGRVYRRVLKAISLLGQSWQAVDNLKPINLSSVEALYSRSAAICYDERGQCFKRYDVRLGRPQHEVNLRSVAPDADSSCRSCKFYDSKLSMCDMVDGRMGENAMCDLYEKKKKREYSIKKTGSEFHVISGKGLIMGAHTDLIAAERQRRELSK